jgi:hypothetical protein
MCLNETTECTNDELQLQGMRTLPDINQASKSWLVLGGH